MSENPNMQSDEAFAKELLCKKDRGNLVKEIFDRFSIDCINAQHLDSQKLDVAIEQFHEEPENLTLLTEIFFFASQADGRLSGLRSCDRDL